MFRHSWPIVKISKLGKTYPYMNSPWEKFPFQDFRLLKYKSENITEYKIQGFSLVLLLLKDIFEARYLNGNSAKDT